MTREKSYDGIC